MESFNGTKFRIDDAYEESGKTIFHLGITCYKDFIGTNWSPRTKEIQQLGISKCGNSHAFMSDALGVVVKSVPPLFSVSSFVHCFEFIFECYTRRK